MEIPLKEHEIEYAEARENGLWAKSIELNYAMWFQSETEFGRTSFGVTRPSDTEFVIPPDNEDKNGASANLSLFHWYG